MTAAAPAAFSAVITASPTGPQPSTRAVWPSPTAALRTACRPTAMGSVSAAKWAGVPAGTGSAKRSDSKKNSANAPWASFE